jgi:hypothetical protein
MGWALRARWAWFRRTDSSRPWASFPIKLGRHVEALVHAATIATLLVMAGSFCSGWTDGLPGKALLT